MPTRRTATAASAPIDVHTTVNIPPNPPIEKPKEDKPDFWTYMSALTPEEWKNHIVYLTRENPKTSINGLGGYLTKLQQPFDIEDIKLAYGGYEFSYILKRGTDLAYSGRFKVEAPPKYDPSREQAASPSASASNGTGNADFQKEFIQVLREELARSRETPGNGANEHIVDMLTKASDRAMEIVTRQTPQAGSRVSEIREMIAALKDLGVVGPQERQKTLIDQVVELLTNPLIGPKVLELFAPKNPLAQLDDLNKLMDFALKMKNGDAEPADWKAMATKMVAEHLPEILDAIKGNRDTNTAAAAAQAREAAIRASAPRTVPITQQQPVVAARPQQPHTEVRTSGFNVVSRENGDAPAAPIGADAPAPAPASQEEYDAAMKINCVNMMRMGASGCAIAAFLEDVKPELAKDLTKYSEQVITDYFAQDPVLKLMVDDPHWLEVLCDAREFLSEDEPALRPA